MDKLYMPERILECVSRTNNNPEFIDLVKTRLENVVAYSHLPNRYLINGIDINNSSSKLKLNLDMFISYINQNENCLVRTDSFEFSGYIAAYIFEQYVYEQLCTDEHIKSILYIDTNLIAEDYRKLITISQSNQLHPRLQYDTDLLYNKILDADFVFWDKFNYNKTNYSVSKLYEVLTIRYMNCLGNCFFVSGPDMEEIMKGIDREFLNIMSCGNNLYDFQREKYNLRK